jgi:methyl-accepting chemotaxis protein
MHIIAPAPVTSRDDLAHAALDAINRAQAIIEFDSRAASCTPTRISWARSATSSRKSSASTTRMFCDDVYGRSREYRSFWKHLAAGEFHSGEFRRIAKDGRPVWIQATYNPIFDAEGKPARS